MLTFKKHAQNSKSHHIHHIENKKLPCLYILILMCYFYSLCSSKCQFKVVFAVGGRQRVVVKLSWEEGMDQSTESHPITPTGWEVLDVNVLQGNRGKEFVMMWQVCMSVSVSEFLKESSGAERLREVKEHDLWNWLTACCSFTQSIISPLTV